ncbi:MAG: wax ester/triacylglycerol synthase family O-acyltransferase [SAR324 cluster bacterium]|nr:wax ester/triacylglycerol synthase family O-acyltransferase [SAR324 cluster bacterium]
MKKLSLIDSLFIKLETPERLMHVASLLVFKLPENYEGDYFADVIKGFRTVTQFIEPFNEVAVMNSWGQPYWKKAEKVNLDYHVQHIKLPQPGTYEELLKLVSKYHSNMLGRSKPLWECYLIEGLEDNRFAIYFKVHHACMDGMGRMRVVQAALNKTPEDRTITAPWQEKRQASREKESEPLKEQIVEVLRKKDDYFQSMKQAFKAVWDLKKQPLDPAQALMPLPFTSPQTPFNVAIDGKRAFVAKTFSLPEFKELSRSLNGTVNDVVLSVCSGALRKYLESKQCLPEKPLTAFIPVSIRPKDGKDGGNFVSNMICNLGTNLSDPRERLKLIQASANAGKSHLKQLSVDAAQSYTILSQTPAIILQVLDVPDKFKPSANLLISNYPGPKQALYLNGALLETIHPISFLFGGHALNITLTSYMDTLNFGLIANGSHIRDLDKIGQFLEESLAELKGIV